MSARWLCLILAAAVMSPAASSYSLDAASVRQVLEATMRCQQLRQLHAAVVHRDSDVYSVRLELMPDGQIRDITENKLLYLASISKGMFGTGLVRVEQHLRNVLNNQSFSLFNTPIKQLIGDNDYWFLDQVRSELVNIDDLISHRTGLARHDGMWYLFDWQDKQDLVNHVSRLKATAEYRNSFVYNNLAWTVADVTVQKLTNRTFVQYMREFLWRPLGMGDTHGSSEMKEKGLLSRLDISRDHRPLGLPLDMSMMEWSTRYVEAAGGILTSLSDMMKYMKLHVAQNYSFYQPVPGQFLPLNAQAATSGFSAIFTKQLYNDGITNLPEWEIETYTRGWLRSWYMDHLDYSHGGSLLGVRAELDVYSKLNLAVFNHMTMGSSEGAPFQTAYAIIINKYITDLLIANQSFVNKDNVCSLFKTASDPGPVRLARRQLTSGEVDALTGSYGNYGFGKVQLTYNQTAKTLSLAYGLAEIELIPVQPQDSQDRYQFFLNLLKPLEYAEASARVILNRTDEAIFVPTSARASPQSYLTAARDSAGNFVLEAAILEQGMRLERGLEPNTWKRPQPCPDGKSATFVTSAAQGFWPRLAAAAAAASVLLVGAREM